jgi:hypothetical protein
LSSWDENECGRPPRATPTFAPPPGAYLTPQSETISEAIAVATGYGKSAVATAVFTIEKTAATPTIRLDGGTFGKAQSVTIKDGTADAAIYYTTSGAKPTAKSTKYTKAFTLSANKTVKAIAIAARHEKSAVAIAKFTID